MKEYANQSPNGAKYSIFGMANPLLVFRPLCPKGSDDVHCPDFEGDELDYIGFISFSDPDGNEWAVQQILSRL